MYRGYRADARAYRTVNPVKNDHNGTRTARARVIIPFAGLFCAQIRQILVRLRVEDEPVQHVGRT